MKLMVLALFVSFSVISFAEVPCDPNDASTIAAGLDKNQDAETAKLVAAATGCSKRVMGQLEIFKFQTSEGVVSLSYDAVAHVVTNVKKP